MKKIEIFQGCRNCSTRIDGVGINDIPLDELKEKVKILIDKIGYNDELKVILELLIEQDSDFELTDEYDECCDQCGDYIWDRTYEKTK